MKLYFLIAALLIVENTHGASYSIVDVVTATSFSIAGTGDVQWFRVANLYSASTTDYASTSGSMSSPNALTTDSLKFSVTLAYRGLLANTGITIRGITLNITGSTSSDNFNSFDISKIVNFIYLLLSNEIE
jgi:hypothetical protein